MLIENLVNPYIATAVIGGGIFFVSFMLGKWSKDDHVEDIVDMTVTQLIADGYIKSKINSKGEV